MIIVGLVLFPIYLLIMYRLKEFNIKKISRFILNAVMIISAFLYILLCLITHIEPFNFEVKDVTDYLIYTAVVFVFSPSLWILLYYYCRKLFKNIRLQKNAKLKTKIQYDYYRDDLNKISPSIIMFTSIMDTDIKKSIAATILKLKLTGYINETKSSLKCTDKVTDDLLESEKIILDSIKTKHLNKKLYKKTIEKETIDLKYVKYNKGGKLFKLIKIFATILLPIIILMGSFKFDDYVFDQYEVYVLDDVRYLKIKDNEIVEKLYNEIEDKNDYKHSVGIINGKEQTFYSYDLIRMDKTKYGIVRFKILLDILDALLILFSIVMIFVSLFMIIEQIIYFNKGYRRTIKGNDLLNKAYALKNYLNAFSLIKNRNTNELVLWEYYLIYAVILDVNIKVKDEIAGDYFEKTYLE